MSVQFISRLKVVSFLECSYHGLYLGVRKVFLIKNCVLNSLKKFGLYLNVFRKTLMIINVFVSNICQNSGIKLNSRNSFLVKTMRGDFEYAVTTICFKHF